MSVKFYLLCLAVLVSACVPSPQLPQSRAPVFIPARPVPRPIIKQDRSTPPQLLFASLKAVVQGFDGQIGVAVMRVGDGWLFSYRADQFAPQQSVSKLWVALSVFDAIDSGRLSLATPVTITRSDLTLFHQPVAQLVGPQGYQTNVSELLLRAMTQSDNTANDSLLRSVGGPEAVRAVLIKKGLSEIRFGDGERTLQSKTAGLKWRQDYSIGNSFYLVRDKLPFEIRQKALADYLENLPDGATPQGIVRALDRLKRGLLLSANSTRLLLSLMNEAKTGKQRIAGGVPQGWSYGHKTGTGQELRGLSTGYNDVGIMTAPDGTSYAVAVMIASTRRPIPERQAVMQGISATIAAQQRQ